MRKAKVEWLHDELDTAADAFEKQAEIHKKFAEEAPDEYIRGWHMGISSSYYDAMCDIRGWIILVQEKNWNAIRVGLACALSTLESRITRHSDPTDTEFSRGYGPAQATKSKELLLLFRNWQRQLGPRR